MERSGSDPAPYAGAADHAPPSWGELAAVFLRISLLGFGGPNAHLALMLDEVVERRGWVTREHFLELVGVTNLLPGPNSSEVAIHLGYTQRGWPGALVTGLAFLLPTFLMVTGLAALYFRLGSLPAVDGVFETLQPAVVALIFWAAVKLGRAAVATGLGWLLAAAGVAVGIFLGPWAPLAMAAGGVVTWLLWRRRRGSREMRDGRTSGPTGAGADPAAAPGTEPPSDGDGPRSFLALPAALSLPSLGLLGSVFWTHLWIGAVLFGGGYVLVALLEPWAVVRYGWLTAAQFLDGVALTQAVPGPISTLSAFVGYAAAGVPGAVAGTVGVYLPAFAVVLFVAPRLARLRRRDDVKAALEGVNAVVVGVIAGVGVGFVPTAVTGTFTAAVGMVALALLASGRASGVVVVLGALAVGLARAVAGV